MNLNRIGLALLLITALMFSVGFNGSCGKSGDPNAQKDEVIAYARDIIASANTIATIVGPGAQASVAKITDGATKIINAADAGDFTNIAQFVADIIPAFNEIANQSNGNKTVQIALAIIDVGLTFYANHFHQAEAAGITRTASTHANVIEDFKKGPHFRARSSVTGKFITIADAKAHPDTSVVERVQ